MIHITGKIPHKVYIACSGGVDSMVITDFLKNGKKDIHLLFFNHGTETSKEAQIFLEKYSKDNNIPLSIGNLTKEKSKEESPEEFWRIQRYQFFNKFTDSNVITCHHLGDQLEQFIMTAIRNGNPTLIPYKNGNILRPFITNPKEEFYSYAKNKNLTWLEDKSNLNCKYVRNRIRNNVIPELLLANPGYPKTIKKLIKKMIENN